MPSKAKFWVDDLTMKNRGFYAHVALSRFNPRFHKAQLWLDQTVMSLMHPIIPFKTGEFLGKILNANAGNYGTGLLKVAVPPQGRYLYPGVSPSGKPFKWTNPNTQPRWGSYTIKTHKPELLRGVKDIILGRDK